MGRIMKEDDVYISGLLDILNIRFGPSQGPGEAYGGIPEMAALQREFKIFERGRSLRSCFAVLNLGGFWNTRAKNRWLELIDDLRVLSVRSSRREGQRPHHERDRRQP